MYFMYTLSKLLKNNILVLTFNMYSVLYLGTIFGTSDSTGYHSLRDRRDGLVVKVLASSPVGCGFDSRRPRQA